MVLYLAINRAIRLQVGAETDVPMVVDADLGILDMGLLLKVRRFIEHMADQIILLERCIYRNRIRLAAYEIRPEAGTGKSRVIKCQ